MVGVLRTIGCVGDSLSSGEFESTNLEGGKGYHDYFDYSWGQYMARMAGVTVRNFSRGGMTAQEYCETFASQNDFWNPELVWQRVYHCAGLERSVRPQDGRGHDGRCARGLDAQRAHVRRILRPADQPPEADSAGREVLPDDDSARLGGARARSPVRRTREAAARHGGAL